MSDKIKVAIIISFFIGMIVGSSSVYVVMQKNIDAITLELNDSKELVEKELESEIKKSDELNESLNNTLEELKKTEDELKKTENKIEEMKQKEITFNGWKMCWRDVELEDWEIDFFAKLLYCEAGSMGYEGQFWVASAILNFAEHKQMSIWEVGHRRNFFEVAPWVDKAVPTQQQYDIIYEALNGGWIADVTFFRTDYPHSFGKFMTQIENVYFNSPS